MYSNALACMVICLFCGILTLAIKIPLLARCIINCAEMYLVSTYLGVVYYNSAILITTLGITELTVVYCPIRNVFHLEPLPLGNSQENTSKYHNIWCIDQLVLCLQTLPNSLRLCLLWMDISPLNAGIFIRMSVTL